MIKRWKTRNRPGSCYVQQSPIHASDVLLWFPGPDSVGRSHAVSRSEAALLAKRIIQCLDATGGVA